MIKKNSCIGLLLILLFGIIICISSCGNKEEKKTGYDGSEFDISSRQDNSLKAKLTKIDNNYKLTIKGSGNAIDYSRKENVPWNAVSKKISEVEIEEGIENIGNYFFYATTISSFIIPSTCTRAEEFSFPADAKIYSYGDNLDLVSTNPVYYYSYDKPTENSSSYWHMFNGIPLVWDKYKILFIGNSFTYYPNPPYNAENPGVPNIFKELAESMKLDVEVDYVTKGAWTLKKFADASDECGAIVDSKLRASDDYDFVLLQEQSTTPVNNYNSFNQGVKSLVKKISETQKNCEVILYSTWGFPSEVNPSGNFTSVGVMEGLIREAYEKCASELDLRVSYVGKAFTDVYDNHKDINLYWTDSKHQAYTGAYLSACVHLETLLNVNVTYATYTGSLSSDVAAVLREVAHKTVSNK